MRVAFLSIWAVLVSVGFLQIANGLQTDIIGMRAGLEAFPAWTVGLMMAAYYVGYSLSALAGHAVIGKFGHGRTIVVCALIAAAVIVAHPMLVTPALWAGYRFVSGFALSLIYVAYESWINERVPNALRGRVFGTYLVVQMASMTLAQALLTLGDPRTAGLFLLSGGVFVLAAFPGMTLRSSSHTDAPPSPLSIFRLFRLSPLGATATVLAGASWAVIFAFGPVYAQRAGFSVAGVGLFIGLAMAAGCIMQFPLGWLSDMAGRRPVIALTFAMGLAASLFGVWATHRGLTANLVAAALAGSFIFPIYGISVAHVNDVIASQARVAAAAGLVLLFGIGSIFGPLLCGWATTLLGPVGFFTVLAATMAAGVAATARWR